MAQCLNSLNAGTEAARGRLVLAAGFGVLSNAKISTHPEPNKPQTNLCLKMHLILLSDSG